MLSGVILQGCDRKTIVTALGRHVRFNVSLLRQKQRRQLVPARPQQRTVAGFLHSTMSNLRKLSTSIQHRSLVQQCVSDGSPSSVREYLQYAKFRDLNVSSTVFIGSLYELQVKDFLESHWKWPPISKAEIVGGSGDRGVDIDANMGTFRLLVQCKCYSNSRIDPKLLREIKGSIGDVPVDDTQRDIPLVSMIASTNGFTRQGRSEFDKANIPMIFLKFSKPKLLDISNPYSEKSWQRGEMLGWESNWMAKDLGLCFENSIEVSDSEV